ncbi:piggyBac transposable element-derived protein 3-like [Penaeus vannamei]|uniref:piggyBac transposable element-derived protein 3-like n=1 Tax=Penaeus vannamei TaxID=6689 RepID=UPI00387F4A66
MSMNRYRNIAYDHGLIQAIFEDIPSGSEEEDTSDDETLVDVDRLTEEPTTPDSDFQPRWRKRIYDVKLAHFQGEQPGPSSAMTDLTEITPSAVFVKLVGIEMLESIVYQTSLCAIQKGKPFKHTTDRELKIFLGMNLLMGMKKQASYQDYWYTDPYFRDNYNANAMNRDRFTCFFLSNHISDNYNMPNRNVPNYDRLYKIIPLIEHLNKQFQTCYNPSNTGH